MLWCFDERATGNLPLMHLPQIMHAVLERGGLGWAYRASRLTIRVGSVKGWHAPATKLANRLQTRSPRAVVADRPGPEAVIDGVCERLLRQTAHGALQLVAAGVHDPACVGEVWCLDV